MFCVFNYSVLSSQLFPKNSWTLTCIFVSVFLLMIYNACQIATVITKIALENMNSFQYRLFDVRREMKCLGVYQLSPALSNVMWSLVANAVPSHWLILVCLSTRPWFWYVGSSFYHYCHYYYHYYHRHLHYYYYYYLKDIEDSERVASIAFEVSPYTLVMLSVYRYVELGRMFIS